MTAAFFSNTGPDIKKDKARDDKFKECREKLAKLTAELPPFTQAMAVNVDKNAPKAYIALGGDYRTKGPEVEPGVPAILTQSSPKDRLSFAKWLTGPENPLTARVAVNRMWQEFFGRGHVRTSEDFGTQGEKPTHPELLDWLASEFRDTGWSMKRMHRLIVTSAAYRQSSKARNELKERDPENTLISRQTRLRLPAELVRDAALASSGLLNTSIGGPSIKPPQPAGVAELVYGNSGKWAESTGRRSVPSRLVHPLPADRSLSAVDELRRAGLERRLHAAITVEYSAAGFEFAERSGVLRSRRRHLLSECFRSRRRTAWMRPSGWCWAVIRLRANESDSESTSMSN